MIGSLSVHANIMFNASIIFFFNFNYLLKMFYTNICSTYESSIDMVRLVDIESYYLVCIIILKLLSLTVCLIIYYLGPSTCKLSIYRFIYIFRFYTLLSIVLIVFNRPHYAFKGNFQGGGYYFFNIHRWVYLTYTDYG